MRCSESRWSCSIYSHPKCFDLEIIGDIELDNNSYEFNIVAFFWDDKEKKVYALSDSGCSCPMPFEDLTREDLVLINSKQEASSYTPIHTGYGNTDVEERARLLSKVEEYIRRSN